jgi:cytochrome c-type biogenesis protein CcmE
MKQKYKRLKLILVLIVCLSLGLWLILKNFNDNIVFFYSPTELKHKPIINQLIRVGGLISAGSITKIDSSITEFSITDNQTSLVIRFSGILPNLFRENQGMVAKGKLVDGIFIANELLSKHDENYMPKEVANSLKKGQCPTCK